MGKADALKLPCSKEEFIEATKGQVLTIAKGDLRIIIGVEDGKWHISLSTASRLPIYAEMKYLRYELLPDDCYMAMIFPPKAEFVNVHEFTLHLWEVDP